MKSTKSYQYELEFLVRDYECDLQGIVNNANYQHYLEHARHQFLFENGLDFAQLHADGIDLIVTRAELDYKASLVSRDRFVVKLNIEREGNIKMVFNQDIFRIPDGKLVLSARMIGVGIRNGRPVRPDSIEGLSKLLDE